MPDVSESHPTFRRLVDLRDGVLAGARLRATEEHLARGCAACDTQLADIVRLEESVAAGRLPAPPRALVRKVKQVFRRQRVRSAVEGVRRLVARLVFDQELSPVPALRSASGSARRLLWNVGDLELFVTLHRSGAAWNLRGEFLPVEDDGETSVEGDVALLGPHGPVAATELDPGGAFAFRDVGPDRYEFEAVVNGARVLVPAFVIG
jgi:hypothetical protein